MKVVCTGHTLENCITNMLSKVNIWHRCQTCGNLHDHDQNNICHQCYLVTQLPNDQKFTCLICNIVRSNENRKINFCGHNEMCKPCWFEMSGFQCPFCRQDIIKAGPMIPLKLF